MDERQKRIIKAGGEKNLLDASLRVTEVSRRITDIVPKLPMTESLLKVSEKWRRISEMVRPPLLAQQHNTFKSIAEVVKPFAVLHNNTFESILISNKLLSDYQWVNDMFKPATDFCNVMAEQGRRIQQLFTAPVFPALRFQQQMLEMTQRITRIIETVHLAIEEIESRKKSAEEEMSKIPVKLNTVSDNGFAIQQVELDILRIEKIKESCGQIVREMEHCIERYNEMTGIDFREEIEQAENALNEMRDYKVRCDELLKAKHVQLVFLTQTDAEYQARPKPKSPEEECHVFFPDYVSEFLEMEQTLIQYKHLSSDLHWIKDKQLLASFVQKLLDFKYIRLQNRKSIKEQRKTVREFFELRYGEKITEQFKPSKVEQHPLPASFPVVLTQKG